MEVNLVCLSHLAIDLYLSTLHTQVASKTPQQDQLPAAYGETAGKIISKLVRPLVTDPVKPGRRSALFAATSRELVEGEGVQGPYIMPDKKISEASKKGQDEAVARRLWNLGIGLLKEKLGVLDYGFAV
jgi:WW domain-containing oxidoreductase